MKTEHEIKMWTPFTMLMCGLMGIGGLILQVRLFKGLGAVTNLNDRFPWGLWIGIDVLGGVAMAAGGFIIAGAVYILNMKKYRPIVRASILNAFFGYLLAATAITLDIGLPWNIWHPIFMWQIHSIMWVVAIHVVLYTTTLATESSPMFFEKFGMEKAAGFIHKIIVPVVLFGVLLSTLHQSSLGSLYLIVPDKMYPLWYSAYMPVFFYASAIAAGCAMIIFESFLSSRAFLAFGSASRADLILAVMIPSSTVLPAVAAQVYAAGATALCAIGAVNEAADVAAAARCMVPG